jgi:uncharacterized protein YheU (UPF0270 family)
MQIPWDSLSADALTGLIEEFITREGTDYGRVEVSLEDKVKQVKKQLVTGDAVIFFDQDAQTCNILPAREVEQNKNKSETIEPGME